MDLIFLKNSINIQKYLVSRYICKSILYLVSRYFLAESIVSVSRYIFKSILQYSAYALLLTAHAYFLAEVGKYQDFGQFCGIFPICTNFYIIIFGLNPPEIGQNPNCFQPLEKAITVSILIFRQKINA